MNISSVHPIPATMLTLMTSLSPLSLPVEKNSIAVQFAKRTATPICAIHHPYPIRVYCITENSGENQEENGTTVIYLAAYKYLKLQKNHLITAASNEVLIYTHQKRALVHQKPFF